MAEIKKYSRQFVGELRELRDEALVESYWEGQRHGIGPLYFGRLTAMWSAQGDALSQLERQGPMIGNLGLYGRDSAPDQLFIVDEDEDKEFPERKVFSMNLDSRNGYIDIYNRVELPPVTGLAALKRDLGLYRASKLARKMGLSQPTEEDLGQLRTELERGASGAYARSDLYD